MNHRKTTLERAYELASSGSCASVTEIKKTLQSEGYADIAGQLFGPSISKDLRRRCADARAAAEAAATAEG